MYRPGLGQCSLTPCLVGLLLPLLFLGGDRTEPWEEKVRDLKCKLHEVHGKLAFVRKLKKLCARQVLLARVVSNLMLLNTILTVNEEK